MEKITNRDYPFTIMIEDKIGQNSGKLYQAISIGHTSVKNKEATDPKEKYATSWFNMFNESDLLKLANLATETYRKLKAAREKERAEKRAAIQAGQIDEGQTNSMSHDELDDDCPF